MPSLKFEWDPEQFRDMIYAHQNSERIRWLVSRHNPAFSRQTGSAGSDAKWVQVEKNNASQWRCVVQHSRQTRTFQQSGSIVSSAISITFMPDEMNIMANDLIIPMGDNTSINAGNPLTAVITNRESITRGWSSVIVTGGALTATGTSVTISGADATKTFATSDVIMAMGERIRIASVNSPTSITLEAAPSIPWNGVPFHKCSDQTLFQPVAALYAAVSGANAWNPYTDMTIGADDSSVQWQGLSNSPTVGEEYTLDYAYYPTYVVLEDEGYRRHVTGGVQLPITLQCSLWVPEDTNE